MDQLLDSVRDALEGQIDFKGQRVAELLSTVLLILTGIFAFIVGYVQQNIHATVATAIAGTLITFLVVVPPWPFLNLNPEKWVNPNTRGVQIKVR